MKKVAVLLGGNSPEREVSFNSGKAVAQALRDAGYDVSTFDPKKDPISKLIDHKPDVAFIALHGKGGEDGTIQGMLDYFNIPYTGSKVLESALCLDKILTKQIIKEHEITTPKFQIFHKDDLIKEVLEFHLKFPAIVKPHNDGSTIGMSIIQSQNELKPALKIALEYSDNILVEEFISGKEVTVGMINGKALPLIEIAPVSGFYDYEAKYTKGKTEYFVPARIEDNLAKDIQSISEKIYKVLNLRGAPRVDFIISEDKQPYFLEVNTIPGMTETSLLPKAAKANGLSFQDLCVKILEAAF